MNHELTCLAHRGASGHEPENSMRSFRKAIEMGVSWIECDVREVECQAVIFHDRRLKRMTGDPGIVSSQTLKHIQSLSLPLGEKIPLLSEVLHLCKGKVSLQVELKGRASGLVVARELLQALSQGWPTQSLLVSSFDYEELAAFHSAAPTIPIGVLVYGYPLRCVELAREFGAYSVHLHMDAVSQERVHELRAAGFKVFVYTVNEPDDIAHLRSLQVDGIFSDFPERVLRAA